MKKKKLILLLSLPALLFSCERTSASSENNSSTYSSTTTSSTSSSLSSSKKTSSDTSQEKAEFTKLKTSLTYVSRQDKMEVSTSNGTLDLKAKGKEIKTETSTEGEDTEGDGSSSSSGSCEEAPSTTETAFDSSLKASNLSLDLAAKGLKANSSSKVNASLIVNTDLNVNNTTGSGEDASTKTISKEDIGFKAYVKDNYAYLNLDNDALQSLITESTGDSTTGGMGITVTGKYLKVSLSCFTFDEGTFPLNGLQESDALSLVNSLSSLNDSAQGLFTFRNEEDYTYIDFSLSTIVFRALPDILKDYLEGNLDSESDDYESQKKEIEDNIKTLKQYTNNMSVNKGDFSIGYTTTGIKSFSFDLDLSGTNFDVDSSDSSTDKTHYDSLSIKANSTLSFKYQDDVTVLDPGTHAWMDMSVLFQ